ncbi:Gp37-like protein [Nonomuraea zeae]|uniref:Gp37-like protein n=1 Tax=Nonomuraea zeae TaxID=1642303 RepID=UPI00360EBF0F
MPQFLVEARNAQYERIGIVEQYTTLDVIARFNAVGSWTLIVPAGSPEAALLERGGGIIVWITGLPVPIMSGPITRVAHSWSADQPGKGRITYSGVSDETWLWSRVTLPVPGAGIRNQNQDRYTYSGNVAAALGTLVNVNAGAGARPDRVVPNLEVEAQNFGKRVEVNTRFDTLGIKLQEVAAAAGVGFRVRQGLDDKLTFSVYTPQANELLTRFSPEDGNLADFDYSITAPTATRYVVAAQGEGKFRWLTQYDDGQARTYNDTNPSVEYLGSGWTYAPNRLLGDYFNDVHHTSDVAARAKIAFTGTGIVFFSEKGPDCGVAHIYLDGLQVASVDLNAAVSQYQVPAWQRQDLEYGQHVLEVVNGGTAKLVVDAYRVTGLPGTGHDWVSTPLETFVDRRDIPVAIGVNGMPINPDDGSPAAPEALAELDQAADEAIAESAATAALSITPVDTPSLRYGHDYEVGDIVSVLVDGQVITDVLREVHLSDGTEGPAIKPVIGTEGASETPTLYREIRKLWNSLRKLESRR